MGALEGGQGNVGGNKWRDVLIEKVRLEFGKRVGNCVGCVELCWVCGIELGVWNCAGVEMCSAVEVCTVARQLTAH
jgi:hypothetical protein